MRLTDSNSRSTVQVCMSETPAWLFSFVDLAFLLLIAMTQIGGDGRGVSPIFGDVVLPRIATESATAALPNGAASRWQLRVHPPEVDDARPYELVDPALEATHSSERLAAAELAPRLAGLRAMRAEKPLLSPHADSRSEDLLQAIAVLEDQWPGRRRATVIPRPFRP